MKHTCIILLLMAASVCASCSGESALLPSTTDPDPQPQPAAPLTIDVSTEEVAARAVVQGSRFRHEARVCVWLLNPEGTGNADKDTAYDKSMIYQYKKPSEAQGVWIAMPALSGNELLVTDKPADVLAYYPAVLPSSSSLPSYASLSADSRRLTITMSGEKAFGKLEDYNSDNSFFHKLGGQTVQEVLMSGGEVDYLTGTDKQNQPLGGTLKSTTLLLKHTLSMVILHVYKAPQNTDPAIMKSLTLSNTSTGATPLCKGTVDIATSAFTPNTSLPITYTASMSGFPAGMYYGIFVYPAQFNDDEVSLQMKVDDMTLTYKLKKGAWKPGVATLYEVKLNPTSAEINDGIQIEDWSDGQTHELDVN